MPTAKYINIHTQYTRNIYYCIRIIYGVILLSKNIRCFEKHDLLMFIGNILKPKRLYSFFTFYCDTVFFFKFKTLFWTMTHILNFLFWNIMFFWVLRFSSISDIVFWKWLGKNIIKNVNCFFYIRITLYIFHVYYFVSISLCTHVCLQVR